MDESTSRIISRIILAIGGTYLGWRMVPEDTRSRILKEFEEALQTPLQPAPPPLMELPPLFQPDVLRYEQTVLPPMEMPDRSSEICSDLELWSKLPGCNVCYVTGRRGSGKTLMAMRLAEMLRWGRSCFAVGMPSAADRLLPPWMSIVESTARLPNDCLAIIDEAYLEFHSMDRGSSRSAARAKLLNQSRQRNQVLIIVAQDGRQIDRHVIQAADVFLIKEPGPMQPDFDRPELRPVLERARDAFANVPGDRRELVYAVMPGSGFERLVQVSKPGFWTEDLSTAYGATPVEQGYVDPSAELDLARTAKMLRKQGMSYSEIALALNVSKSTAYNLVNDYPYA